MKKLFLSIPFVFFSFYVSAQISRQQAIEIMINDVVGPDSLNMHWLFSKIDPLILNEPLLLDNNYSILAPYNENWVFYVDLMPAAFWAHPCQIYFIDVSNGDFVFYNEMWPPYPYLFYYNEFITEWEWIMSVGTIKTQLNNEENFTIAPNPFNQRIKISYDKLSEKPITISIFNNFGQHVFSTVHNCDWEGNGTIELNTQKLKPGIFFLQIIKENTIEYQEKIIKR